MTMESLFIPSGARVTLLKLPPVDRPIRLADRRALRVSDFGTVPIAPGEMASYQVWLGPDGLKCIASLDPIEAWGPLLHVSTSYADVKRDPSWSDLRLIKGAFFGDVDAAMILPSKADYINLRSNCFHLWQIPQKWGIR
jgi:hypothetical protein